MTTKIKIKAVVKPRGKAVLPQAHFGTHKQNKIKWQDDESSDDADDVELKRTPKDVVGMLGFDPKKKARR